MIMIMRLACLGAVAALAPAIAHAAQPAIPFDRLQRDLKPDQIVVIVDTAGREINGRVVEVSPASLEIVVFKPSPGSGATRWSTQWTRSEARTLTPSEVAAVFDAESFGARGREIYRALESFGDLQRKLRAGQRAFVVDRNGIQIAGRVLDVSPAALVVQVEGLGEPRTFSADNVTAIKRPGPIWDGAVKGAAVAALVTALLGGGNYPEVFPWTCGMGAGIGVGVDALFGPSVVYRGPKVPRTVSILPVVGRGRHGVQAAIRF